MIGRTTRFSILALGLLLMTGAAAQAEWVALSSPEPAAPSVSATDHGASKVVLEYGIPGFVSEPVEIDGHAYARILLPGRPPILEKGLPDLPAISSSIIIPDEGTPELRILSSKYRELVTAPVAPSKGSLPRTIDPATVPYVFGSFYEDGGVYPAREAGLSTPFILRDHRGVTVQIYPLRYDADRGILLVLESLTVEVTTTGSGGVNVKQRLPRAGVDGQFARIYDEFFVNRVGEKYTPIPNPGPMLVVCHDPFVGPVTPFVEWKQQKGIPVELITTSSVGGTAAGIQTAIDTRYASPEGLTYVVLVGDIAEVPTNSGTYEGADSDPMYGMVDGGDSYPDLFVSRISAQNSTQVQQQVAKFIRYEKDPDLGGDWYHKGTGIASDEGDPSDAQRCDWLRDDLLGYTFTEVDQIYQGPGGTTADITNALNAGRSIVNYLGHGSGNAWTSVYFGTAEVHALANGWAHPWVIDVSCSNGDFSQSECFAEAWLRAGTVLQPTGAVAMYSSSTLAAWVPPTVMQAETVDLLVAETENTIGALYFSGGMKVLDDYPSPSTEGLRLIEQYNIFGDCSLVVRTDTPGVMTASHLPVFPLGATSFSVDVPGLAGATACLWRDGVIHGTAVTDAGGHADIVLDVPILTPGDVTLTVTAYNQAPHIATLQAIVPATVTVVPDSIPIDMSTPVTVTVQDTLGVGIPDVTVYIEGYGVSGLEEITNASGEAYFNVLPLYGEVLTVRGRELGETYDLFNVPLPVYGALDLTSADISAEVASIGLSGALAPGFEGTVTGSATQMGLDLFLSGAGVDTSASSGGSSVVIAVTPAGTGTVTAVLAKTNHNLVSSEIPVIEPYGTLAGLVFETLDGVTPIPGVRVYGYNAGADTSGTPPLFDLLSDGGGLYAVPDSLPVGGYDLYTTKFGYLSGSEQISLMSGPNVVDIGLDQELSGVLTGTVTESVGGGPLEATIEVYRADTMELYTTTTSDPGDGSYTTGSLPYFDYSVTVRASYYIPETVTVTIDQPSVEKHFALDPTIGNLLVIDDSSKRAGFNPEKRAKDGAVLADGYQSAGTRGAADVMTDLEGLGYTVTMENTSSDPLTWPTYDLVIVSCGASLTPVNDSAFRTAVESFVTGGGHLLIEGGEIGYDAMSYPGYSTFAATVLHCTGWNHDSSGDVMVADPAHYVMSVPNVIASPITIAYSGYGDSDAVTIAPEAQMPGSWSTYPTDGSVVTYDPNPSPQGGQIVYFAFNYSALGAVERTDLIQNAVTWLLADEVGNCGVSGTMTLANQGDHSGILVEAIPNGGSTTTSNAGDYSFTGLYPGAYTIQASKAGWSTETTEITLSDGQQLTGVDLTLYPVTTIEICSAPVLPIPDNDPAGVSDLINIPVSSPIDAVEVFLDIAHTFIGDLIVDLTSPEGTTVRLHNRTGGTADNIYGWYPSQLASAESLDAFLDENPGGDWELNVSDNAGSDTGTFNQWCLRITYIDLLSDAGDDDSLPRALALDGNYPNPFNPKTRISFAVPREMAVELGIYDLQGRLVRMLLRETLPGGLHEVHWDGVDDGGRRVSSGMYFYRLQGEEKSFVGKMVLLK